MKAAGGGVPQGAQPFFLARRSKSARTRSLLGSVVLRGDVRGTGDWSLTRRKLGNAVPVCALSSVRLAEISSRRRNSPCVVQFFRRRRPWSALRGSSARRCGLWIPGPRLQGQGGPAGTQASVGPGRVAGRRARPPQPRWCRVYTAV